MLEKQKQANNEKSTDIKTRGKGNIEGEDLADDDEHSEAFSNMGGHRFENLIKSMLARIEIKGNLAPIQEYGRHQTVAAKKRKDNKKAANKEGDAEVPDAGDKEADKYDDKYYDLDDGFIDDESI